MKVDSHQTKCDKFQTRAKNGLAILFKNEKTTFQKNNFAISLKKMKRIFFVDFTEIECFLHCGSKKIL